MEEKEIWKDVIGYEGAYKINISGRIKSVDRFIYSRINSGVEYKRLRKGGDVKQYTQTYHIVHLSKGSKQKTFLVHRLIAIHFIPNPNNYPCVNHIDGNKFNNDLSNLEWCTHRENVQHAVINKLNIAVSGANHVRSIPVLNTETGIYYNTLKDAYKSTGWKNRLAFDRDIHNGTSIFIKVEKQYEFES